MLLIVGSLIGCFKALAVLHDLCVETLTLQTVPEASKGDGLVLEAKITPFQRACSIMPNACGGKLTLVILLAFPAHVLRQPFSLHSYNFFGSIL